MARSKFGGTSDDYVFYTVPFGVNQVVSLGSTVTLTFWSAETSGTQYTDLLLNGSPVTSITTSGGLVPEFQGPDSITEMWADSGSGTRTLLFAQGQQGPQGNPGPTGPPGDALTGLVATVTANGALTAGKHNPVDATSGNLTMTLADASGPGQQVAVEKMDATANTVTVTVAHLRDTGASGTVVLLGQHETRLLESKADGSWWPISDHRTDAYLKATYVANPSTGLAEYAVLAKLTAGTNHVQWTTKEELVARSLGWVVATDARYGVVGDGSTIDTTAVQAAMTATPAGGCTFVPPNLTCIIDAPLVPTPGSRLSAYGTTFKTKPGIAGINIIHPSDGVDVLGLTFDPNKANTTDPGSDTGGIGFYAYNATGFTYPVRLIDCNFKAGYQLGYRIATGVFSVDPASNPVSDVLIQNCNVDSQGSRAARLLNLNGLRIVGGNYTNSGTDGIHIFSCADVQVTNPKCLSNGGHGLVTNYVARFTACGVIAQLNGSGGIVMGGGAATSSNKPSYDWSIVGCNASYNGQSTAYTGIHIDPTVTGSPTTAQDSPSSVVGNVCSHNTVHGIYVNNAGWVNVTGNICHDNTNSGILTSTADGLVDGNVCYNNSGYGIYIAGTASSTRNRMTVGVNYVTGNTLGNYNIDDATMDIRWARFSKAPLVVTASYNMAATDYVVHGNITGGGTISLPDPTKIPAGSAGYLVKNVAVASMTVNSQGTSKTLDGQASMPLTQNASQRFYSDGSNWFTETAGVSAVAPTFNGPVSVATGTTTATIGNNSTATDAVLALNPPSGKSWQISMNVAGSLHWRLYNSGGNNLFIRDDVNGVQAVTLTPGSGTTGQAAFAGNVVAADYLQSSGSSGSKEWSGSGAPTTPGGSRTYNLGDRYWRTDTPGTANQRLYIVTTAGTSPTWTGIL